MQNYVPFILIVVLAVLFLGKASEIRKRLNRSKSKDIQEGKCTILCARHSLTWKDVALPTPGVRYTQYVVMIDEPESAKGQSLSQLYLTRNDPGYKMGDVVTMTFFPTHDGGKPKTVFLQKEGWQDYLNKTLYRVCLGFGIFYAIIAVIDIIGVL